MFICGYLISMVPTFHSPDHFVTLDELPSVLIVYPSSFNTESIVGSARKATSSPRLPTLDMITVS